MIDFSDEREAARWRAIDEFVPVYRGRPVADASPLDPAEVRTVGLMISDRQEGPFRLELASLSAS